MSAGEYALGLVSLAVIAGALVAGACAVRKRVLPGLSGAPAVLADAVLALAGVVLVAELLGAVGLLTRGWLVAGSLLAGGAAIVAARRGRPTRRGVAREPGPEPAADRPLRLAAIGAGLLVIAQWGVGTNVALADGMAMPDTIWYHLPLAAEFAQEGSLTGLHYAEAGPITAFYPANGELFHALGMVLFGHDVLSPFMNLGFVALALLGGWCVGRTRGAGPLGLVALALAVSVPIFWGIQAGQAGNDVVGLAFLAATLGLLLTDDGARATVAVAGLAAGLSLGTKLTMVAPVLALSVAVVALSPRGKRLRASLGWGTALVATGGFWYLRNLFRTGSPLPWLDVDLGPIRFDSPPRPLTEGLEFPVAHYATDFWVWRDFFIPNLDYGLGWAWPVLLLLAAAGVVSGVASGRGWARALGLVGAASFVAYLFTPNGAGGREGAPWGFGLNLRYVVPALAVSLAALVLARWLADGRRRRIAFGVMTAVLVFNLFTPSGLWSYRRIEGLAWLAASAAVVGLAWLVRRSGSRLALVGATAALLVALVGGGWLVQRDYLRDRYAKRRPNVPATSVWARGLEGAAIGVLGFVPQYPLYGTDLSNRVEQIGRRGPRGAFGRYGACPAWRRAVNAGRYRYLVVSPVSSPNLPPTERPPAPPELAWTRGNPAAEPVLEDGDTTVFRLDGPLRPQGCARAASGRTLTRSW